MHHTHKEGRRRSHAPAPDHLEKQMTIRNRTLAVGGLAALVLAGAAVPATPHTAVATRDCDGITIYAGRFMPGPNPARAVVAIDGENVTGYDVELDNKKPARIPLILTPGNHYISVSLAWSLPDNVQALYVAGQGVVTCPEPPPVVEEPPPVVEQPPVAPPVVDDTPDVSSPWVLVGPPPRPRYTCPRLLPSKSWQRIIFRRHGVRCPLKRPAPPRNIAVLGERR